MEHNDRRQRQNNPPGYAAQQGLISSSAQYPTTSAIDRFRQPPLTGQSPTSAPSAGRAGTTQGYNYGYTEGAQFAGSSMQASELQYQSDYAQNPSAQQQYPQYGTSIMYNVPSQQQQQQQQQQAVQSPYEPVQPYPPRQSAAIDVLANQFGVPQQYYMEGGPTSAPAMQYPALSYTTQSPVARQPLASAYAGGMADPAQGSSQAVYPQANYPAQATAQDLDVAYGQYQTELRRTFECVRDGRLRDASSLLVHISDWLLSNAEALGLSRDDETMHAERLKMWTEFNNCWLAVLQKQREMTQEMLATTQRPLPPQSLIDYNYMEHMGRELVRLCDLMEKHGLVDYQLGVWEEEIINLLTQCLDLLEDPNRSANSSTNPRPGPSASSSRRR